MNRNTSTDQDDRRDGLLAWQLARYPEGHTTRSNLLLHLMTAPLFCAGTLAVVAAPFTTAWMAVGALFMLAALVAQGRGHRGEANRPIPFRGPADFVARFFVEQWVTFPRFVLGGGFARAWRRSS
jgi:hypothetical protein